MNDNIKKIAEAYAAECNVEQLDLLRTLGKIPAPSHQEDKRVAFLVDWWKSVGAEDITVDDMKNVIVKYGPQDGELVVFAAHTDIVFPDTEELPMFEENGILHAPGIGDDTSNLVCMLMAAKYVIQNKLTPEVGLLFVANSCEEGLGNLDGTKQLFKDYGGRIREFISFDGYTPQCTYSAVGSYRYEISCKTVGGHSYVNFGNPNAIEILAKLIEKLYEIKAPTEEFTTYNVGVISGGSTVNSIAQQASMMYEFRSSSQKCLDQMEKMFTEAVDSCRDCGGELEVKVLGIRPGNGDIDKDALAAFTARNSEVISAFYEGELDYAAYSTDSNIPLSMGIPANTIGAMVGAKAHTREEWVELKSLTPGLKIALSLMLGYCGK